MENVNMELIREACMKRLKEMRIEGAERFSPHERVLFSGGRTDPEAPRLYDKMDNIRIFEKYFEATAWFVVHAKTPFGEEDAILFVSHDPDSWASEEEALIWGEVLAFVFNRNNPLRNGIHRVGIAPTQHGGLWRHF